MRVFQKLFLIAICSACGCVAAAQSRQEPMEIGGSRGVDGSYCESAKADFDLIAQVANERKSNVIIIARLGSGERPKSNSIRLSQLRDWLQIVRAYSPDRVITAKGDRVSGLGRVEIYVSGKQFIIYRMRRNRDFFTGNFGC